MTETVENLTAKYFYYLEHGLHEAATIVRRRLNTSKFHKIAVCKEPQKVLHIFGGSGGF